ncbi:MAG TPA: hypothetical protein VMU43_14910 [Candidatus Acidoferrum sp.]|nr:hypothetical protein [Candidatus Acidoferrum sp.]
MPKFEKHIFICTNQRPPEVPKKSCNASGEGELARAFKDKLAQRGMQKRVRSNKAGCLDQCEHGPTVVVYPDAVWYGTVGVEDVDEIIDSHIVGGRPVERLMIPDECLNSNHVAEGKPCEFLARRKK